MKKFTAILMCAAMLLCFAAPVGAVGDFEIVIAKNPASVQPGQNITLTVSLKGTPDSRAGSIEVVPSSGLEIVSGEMTKSGALIADFTPSNGKGVCSFASATPFDGSFARVVLKVKADVTSSQSARINVSLKPGGETSSIDVNIGVTVPCTHEYVQNPAAQYLKSAATCTSKAVYYESCKHCGEKGTKTFEYGSPLGHDWGKPVYQWPADASLTQDSTVTAKRVCTRDGSHVETETVGIASVEVAPAEHCGEQAKYTYTTKPFTNSAFSVQKKTVSAGDPLEHDWGEWTVTTPATDTAPGVETRTCKRDPSHTETRAIPATGGALKFIPGDINNNGAIDANDYSMAKRYVLGTFSLTADEIMRGDIDKNGDIDALEYAMIKRHCLGTYVIPGAEGK